MLDRAFEPGAPDRAWAADMTYIATEEGWLYLSVVLDLFSRRVVGWSAQPSLSRQGPIEALTSAIRDRRPAAGLVAHSPPRRDGRARGRSTPRTTTALWCVVMA